MAHGVCQNFSTLLLQVSEFMGYWSKIRNYEMSNWNNRTRLFASRTGFCLQNDLIKLKSQTLKNEHIFTHSLEVLRLGRLQSSYSGPALCPGRGWLASLNTWWFAGAGFLQAWALLSLGLYMASVAFARLPPPSAGKQTLG